MLPVKSCTATATHIGYDRFYVQYEPTQPLQVYIILLFTRGTVSIETGLAWTLLIRYAPGPSTPTDDRKDSRHNHPGSTKYEM